MEFIDNNVGKMLKDPCVTKFDETRLTEIYFDLWDDKSLITCWPREKRIFISMCRVCDDDTLYKEQKQFIFNDTVFTWHVPC